MSSEPEIEPPEGSDSEKSAPEGSDNTLKESEEEDQSQETSEPRKSGVDNDFYKELLQEKKSSADTLSEDLFKKDEKALAFEEYDVVSQATQPTSRATSKSVTIDLQYFLPSANAQEEETLQLGQEEGSYALVVQGKEVSSREPSEQEVKEEAVESTIDRHMYYEMHTLFNQQYKKEKLKNNFLQMRLAAYYTKRKMTYVLREPFFHLEELQKKYETELEDLEDLIETSEREKQMNEDEFIHMKNKRDMKKIELEALFAKLQQQEAEYGKGLTFEKTGRHNMDKVVERFIKRQKTQTLLTMKLRSEYINLTNRMNEKLKALDALDHLGPGFRIMDYVQLKTDNRDLHDKFEEKENELILLRKSCQNTMQILAHNREKSAVIDLDIGNLKEELESIDMEYEEARQNLHFMIQERDQFRTRVKNIKMQYSLFINRKLLRDMEHSVDEVDELKQQLENAKADYQEAEYNTKMVRKNLLYFQHNKNKEKKVDQSGNTGTDDIS